MIKNKFGLMVVSSMLVGLSIACSFDSGIGKSDSDSANELPKHLQSYEIKGIRFAYYLIPKDLSEPELIKIAKEIHGKEADAQLLLVDDDSKVDEYITYVKAISTGGGPADIPAEWADGHIIANVQKYLNGRWVLCRSNGYEEIADLD